VVRLQLESERIPFHFTSTVAGVSLRTTTDLVGMAFGQSCVDQMRSEPEVIFTTKESAPTLKVQAGVDLVFSCMAKVTGLPACAWSLIDGVTTTSLTEQGPLGAGSAVGSEVLAALLPTAVLPLAVGLLDTVAAVAAGADDETLALGDDGVEEACAPTGRADGPLPPPPPPSSRARPKTSRKTSASRMSRLVQYTRGGSGPSGRVTELMARP
jgi:hypothetical protein